MLPLKRLTTVQNSILAVSKSVFHFIQKTLIWLNCKSLALRFGILSPFKLLSGGINSRWLWECLPFQTVLWLGFHIRVHLTLTFSSSSVRVHAGKKCAILAFKMKTKQRHCVRIWHHHQWSFAVYLISFGSKFHFQIEILVPPLFAGLENGDSRLLAGVVLTNRDPRDDWMISHWYGNHTGIMKTFPKHIPLRISIILRH